MSVVIRTSLFVLLVAATGCSHNPVTPEPINLDVRVDAEATTAATTSTARTISGVKFAPQVPPGSWSKTMSCGPAALNMAAAYIWGVTPDQVTYIPKICKFLGKTDTNNCLPGGTSTTDLVSAARTINNLPGTYKDSGWDLARIKQQIDIGRPVVVAVRAGALSNRGYVYSGGHFVLALGYDSGNMIVHDPGTTYGAFKKYSNADFATAMSSYSGAVVIPIR